MGSRFADQAHLFRVAGLFLAGLLVFVVLQALLMPEGFGVYGHFRAGALDESRARPVVYAGRAVCEECHGDVAEARKGSRHAPIGCETCHGAAAGHAQADDPSTHKPARPDSSVCLVCHQPNVARPQGFPQVDPKEHAGEAACLSCHQAHRPGDPPEAKK